MYNNKYDDDDDDDDDDDEDDDDDDDDNNNSNNNDNKIHDTGLLTVLARINHVVLGQTYHLVHYSTR